MKKNHFGIHAIILGSLFFAIFSALNRIIPQNIGTFHQLFIRGFVMGGIFLLIALLKKDLIFVQKKDVPLFLLRGLFIAGDFATFFIAVSFLQLGIMLFLFYAGTVIANYLYGFIFLNEKITKIKAISFFLAIVGLGIMYINNLQAFASVFVLFALFSGFSYGLGTASSKSLSDKYSVSQVNAGAFISAGIISVPILFLSQEKSYYTFFTIPWGSFLLWMSVGVIAFYIIIYGFKYVEAQKASLLSLSEILFAVVLGFFVYKEIPTITTLIGGICIILALALPNIQFSKK